MHSSPRSAYRVACWSALISAGLAAAFDATIGLGTLGMPTRVVAVVASLLLAITFVVMVSAVHSSAEPSARLWTQIALSFAILYAGLLLWNYFLQLTVVTTNPQLYPWLTMRFDSTSAFWALETVGYSLMGLSAAFLALLFGRDGLGRVIRWVFLANGLATLIGTIAYSVSGNPTNAVTLFSLGVWAVAMPVGLALVARAFSAKWMRKVLS